MFSMASNCTERQQSHGVVQFRDLDIDTDIPRLRELHGVCFPIAYDDRFYTWLTSPQCICLVATTTAETTSETMVPDVATAPPESAAKEDTAWLLSPITTSAAATVESPSGTHPKSSRLDCVVGFIVGKIKYIEGPLLTNPVVYISTFGVDPDYRRFGVGHELLERFVAMVCNPAFIDTSPACASLREKATSLSTRVLSVLSCLAPARRISQVWLHCLADDVDVIRFYTKRRFVIVEKLAEYYEFGGRFHDALMLCREEVFEPAAVVAARKQDGKSARACQRAGRPQSLWELLGGTSVQEALQAQDDLDISRWSGRSVSRAAWSVGLCVVSAASVACILSLLLWWR